MTTAPAKIAIMVIRPHGIRLTASAGTASIAAGAFRRRVSQYDGASSFAAARVSSRGRIVSRVSPPKPRRCRSLSRPSTSASVSVMRCVGPASAPRRRLT